MSERWLFQFNFIYVKIFLEKLLYFEYILLIDYFELIFWLNQYIFVPTVKIQNILELFTVEVSINRSVVTVVKHFQNLLNTMFHISRINNRITLDKNRIIYSSNFKILKQKRCFW